MSVSYKNIYIIGEYYHKKYHPTENITNRIQDSLRLSKYIDYIAAYKIADISKPEEVEFTAFMNNFDLIILNDDYPNANKIFEFLIANGFYEKVILIANEANEELEKTCDALGIPIIFKNSRFIGVLLETIKEMAQKGINKV